MAKKIITIDEFFRLQEMFRGSREDQTMALEIYNTQYDDKDILDDLMTKALVFKDRKDFEHAIKYKFPTKSGESIYLYIEEKKMNIIYKSILDKLMGHD